MDQKCTSDFFQNFGWPLNNFFYIIPQSIGSSHGSKLLPFDRWDEKSNNLKWKIAFNWNVFKPHEILNL